MSDEARELRRDLGDGWTYIISSEHRDARVHLEGPHGLRVDFPQEATAEVLALLRIGDRSLLLPRHRGRPRQITEAAIRRAIVGLGGSPSLEATAEALGRNPRAVRRALGGRPWRPFRDETVRSANVTRRMLEVGGTAALRELGWRPPDGMET